MSEMGEGEMFPPIIFFSPNTVYISQARVLRPSGVGFGGGRWWFFVTQGKLPCLAAWSLPWALYRRPFGAFASPRWWQNIEV